MDRSFASDRSEGLPEFYGCPSCGRQYVLGEQGALALCWPHPLVMMLHDVSALPAGSGSLQQVADKLQGGQYGEPAGVMAEVELELDAPSHDLGAVSAGDSHDAQYRAWLSSIIALARAAQ